MREFTEQELVRRGKLAKFEELGMDTFGHVFERTAFASEIKDNKVRNSRRAAVMSKVDETTTVDIEIKEVSWRGNGKVLKWQAFARVIDKKGGKIKTFVGEPRGNQNLALSSLAKECELFEAAARRAGREIGTTKIS